MSMKQEYEEKLQAKLDECLIEVDRMKEKADKAESELKAECYKIIEDLRLKQEEFKGKLEEIRQAGEESWEDIKPGAISMYDELTKVVGKAVEWAASKFK